MIKAIIFDLAEVYLKGLHGVEHHLKPIVGADIKKIWDGLQGDDLVSLFRGEITEEEYWLRTIEKNKWKIDVESLKRIVRKNFVEIRGIKEIIEKLKEKGFRLGLLSDHTREWVDYCNKKFGYHKLFHSVLYSFEVGLIKPEDKRIFEVILKNLKVRPEECLFIDDHEKNLISAKELGIKTIHFKNPEQLRKDLASFSINI